MSGTSIVLARMLPDSSVSAPVAAIGVLPGDEADLLAYLTQLAQTRGADPSSIRLFISGTPVSPAVTAVSDAEGNVLFKDLAPGRYSVSARRDGYLNTIGSGAPISVVVDIDSQHLTHDVALSLSHGASITGTVRSAVGRPPANATIEVGTLGYRDGRVTLIGIKRTPADPSGNYRVDMLAPGTYLIRETEPPPRAVSLWFPGTADVDKAWRIAIRGDEEVVGIDFDISSVPTYKVSGIVPNAPARTLPSGLTDHSVPTFSYAPRNLNATDATQAPLIQNARSGPNGEFEIDGIPAGSWYVFPVIPLVSSTNSAGGVSGQFPSAPRYTTGRVEVDVVDRDIRGVNVRLSSAEIRGRVVQPGDFGNPGHQLGPLQISLLARDNIAATLISHLIRPVTSGANGEFAFSGVPPGRYSLRISGLPAGFYVSDIRVGTKSVYQDGIIALGTEPVEPVELRIQYGSGKVQVQVQVTDTNVPLPGSNAPNASRIALVPTDSRRQNLIFYQTRSVFLPSSSTGSSPPNLFDNVAPGEYKVFAWKDLPPGGAEMNPQFLAKYEDQGVTVIVMEGQTSSVQVKLIP